MKTVSEHRGRGWPWGLTILVLALGAAGYFFYPQISERVMAATRPATGPTAGPTTGPAGGGSGGGGRGGRGAGGPTPVLVARSRVGDLPIYLTGLGTVTPLKTVTVRTRVDGEITKINFEEGQEVKEGDLLVQIDARPYEVQLLQAQGAEAKDQELLKNAQNDLALFERAGAGVSRQQIDDQRSLVLQTKATLLTDEANIKAAQLQITYCHITAPISGRVGFRLVDLGNMVHATDATGLLVITQLSPIAVVFSLPQTQLPELLDAMRADPKTKLTVDAFDEAMLRELATGTLEALDNQVDITTGTIHLKALFSNEDGRLFANGFVNARLLERTLRHVVLIPSAGRQIGPDGAFAYVVDGENKVHVRAIKTGATSNETVEVTSGLEGGESVVTDGVDKLTEGATVVPRAQPNAYGARGAEGSSSGPSSRPTSRGSRRPHP